MKKITIGIAILVLLSTSSMAFMNGLLSTPTTGELVKPTYEYELDTWGSNSEVYEFTPKSNTNYTCIMFMLDAEQAMGLQCFPKPTKK